MKVVLTAPATEMSEYNENPAIAFVSGFSKPSLVPRLYLSKRLYRPSTRGDDLSVLYAPLGLRRIESSLVLSGLFNRSDVVVVHPDDVEEVVSEKTRVVGVGVKDPMGLGYVSLTYSTLLGLGDPMNKLEFKRLMRKIGRLKRKHGFRVVVGGPGVWQFKLFDGSLADFGIDVVIEGEGETVAPAIFYKLAAGESVSSQFVNGGITPANAIPSILGPSIYGAVEISRGCGRGCMFCTPTMHARRDLPIEKISRDLEVNLKHGQNKALIVTEDFFIYGSKLPWEPSEHSINRLVNTIARYKSWGLERVQICHMNLASIKYRADLFKVVAEKLYEFSWLELRGKLISTVEVGIESGSPKIIGKYMRGKVLPYKPEDWPEVVLDSLALMEEYDWVALGTIIVGLPGESAEDAYKTLKIVESVRELGLRTFLVPLIFVPLGGCALEKQPIKSFSDLCDVQLEIFSECWKNNVRVWGADHFKSYGALHRLLFKAAAKLYLATVAKKYEWRERIAREVYKELVEIL